MKIIDVEGLKHKGKSRPKTQIVLTHTTRPLNYYINGLKKRYNGRYDKIPHFVISKDGEIYSLISTDTYSNNFDVKTYNRQSILISLENLGWLKKVPLEESYVNWIGDKTNESVYEKKWRGYFFWQKYPELQIDSLTKLIKFLCPTYDIPEKVIGHNVKIDHINRYKGITSKSNYDEKFTGLSPAFDFELFINKIKEYDE